MLGEFYGLYRQLQKSHDLRMNAHFDTRGNNFIEVWEYADRERTRRVCHASAEDAETCYLQALSELRHYQSTSKETGFDEQKAV